MTDIDAIDLLTEAPKPALRALADAIDREFERRDPVLPTPYEYAAKALGVDTTELIVLSEMLAPPVAHAVGHWLHKAQARWSLDHVGAVPSRPAITETVPAASGDVQAFSAAMVVLPAGTLAAVPVVIRMAPDRYGPDVELMGRAQDSPQLPELFEGFLRTCRTTESPYRRGAYRVSSNNAGLVLQRWTTPSGTPWTVGCTASSSSPTT